MKQQREPYEQYQYPLLFSANGAMFAICGAPGVRLARAYLRQVHYVKKATFLGEDKRPWQEQQTTLAIEFPKGWQPCTP